MATDFHKHIIEQSDKIIRELGAKDVYEALEKIERGEKNEDRGLTTIPK